MPSVDSLVEAGNVRFAAGAWQDAVDCYTEALASDPASLRALGNRAQALLSLGRWQRAATDARAALVLDSSLAKCHYRLARALGKSGDMQGRCNALARGIRCCPDSQKLHKEFHHMSWDFKVLAYAPLSVRNGGEVVESPGFHTAAPALLRIVGRALERTPELRGVDPNLRYNGKDWRDAGLDSEVETPVGRFHGLNGTPSLADLVFQANSSEGHMSDLCKALGTLIACYALKDMARLKRGQALVVVYGDKPSYMCTAAEMIGRELGAVVIAVCAPGMTAAGGYVCCPPLRLARTLAHSPQDAVRLRALPRNRRARVR